MKPPILQYDVYFQLLERRPQKGDIRELIGTFEEGYAAFIAPLFENLNQESGKTLVFVNGASFGGEDLKFLRQIISVARKQIAVKEENWDVFCYHTKVFMGKNQGYRRSDIYSKVNKYKINLLIDKLETEARRAKSTGAYIVFNFFAPGS